MEELGKLQEELTSAQQDVLYAQAETQNVRRRLEKDIADARAYAVTGFARDILSVADNLARALDAVPAELREDEKLKGLIAGIEATQRELDKVFAAHGITPHRLGRPAARPEPASGDARSADGRCRAGHDRSGNAGGLHDQGPLAASGHGGGGKEAGLAHRSLKHRLDLRD